jgi:glycosyltransferase involved in cell wall biosynthesis
MKILVTSSTFPASDSDKVPAFIKDQVIALKKYEPKVDIIVHAPYNSRINPAANLKTNKFFKESRYHYFWPHKFELLTGRGILPALKQNKLLYFEIPFFIFFQFFSLIRLVRKEKPDFIYAHWFMPQAITSALVSKFTNTPFMFTTHASDVSVLHKFPFARQTVRWVCKRAKAYTAVSDRTASKLMQMFDPEDWEKNFKHKLSIIPMGVATNVTALDKVILDKVMKKYDLPQDRQYVLFLGRLVEKKGVTYLLDAIASLKPEVTKLMHFIIAGDGQLKSELESKASRLKIKNITFTGYVHGTDKKSLLQLAHYTCLPSIIDSLKDFEGFPLVLMESLAAGKVVLASNVSGGETIINHQESGFIFKQKSVESLTKTLTEVASLDNARRAAIQTNSKKMASKFDWNNIAQEHFLIFSKIMR